MLSLLACKPVSFLHSYKLAHPSGEGHNIPLLRSCIFTAFYLTGMLFIVYKYDLKSNYELDTLMLFGLKSAI